MSSRAHGEHPDPPPSAVVRAAQARLIARLEGAAVEVSSERYEFGAPLAAGGLGVVRRAYDRQLRRVVAVKQLHRCDPAAERRFLGEAEITARLQHPGVVPIYDIGRFASGEPYYCMKLIEGASLEQEIRAQPAARERLALLGHVLTAADAVAHAHAQGVVHRDLKPANILVGVHGETVVIDWGLAKDVDASDEEAEAGATEAGTIVGTLRYMPPEQARGEVVDARGDVFALGAVLFQVLVGRAPDEGVSRAGLLARANAGEVEDVATCAEGAPRELVAIVRRAMAAGPEARYADAAAFAEDLRRFLAGRLVAAYAYRPGELVWLWIRRHRGIVVLAAVALLVLGVVSLVFVRGLQTERDIASTARVRAEVAEVEAVRRADTAVQAQARGLLAEDLGAAVETLVQVDLEDEEQRRRARLTAIAAHARGAPELVLRGHARRIEHFAALADGGLASVDVAGEVWRWDADGRGAAVLDLATPRGLVVAAAEAPVWAALGGTVGYVVRGDEEPEAIGLADLDLREFRTHRFEVSRNGEVLAALGMPRHMRGKAPAAAYTWDLQGRPASLKIAGLRHVGWAALAPDGATLAISGEERRGVIVVGDVSRGIELLAPRMFSEDGRWLIGAAAGQTRSDALWDLKGGRVRAVEGGVLAVLGEDVLLIVREEGQLRRTWLARRSIASGEERWRLDVEDTTELRAALWLDDGRLVIDGSGERMARHFDGRWEIRSLATGALERTIDTGPYRRGGFLKKNGRFVVAHNRDLWVWEPPRVTEGMSYVAAISRDGSHAIAGAQTARLVRLVDRGETEVACLQGVRLAFDLVPYTRGAALVRRLAVDGRGRVLFVGEDGHACLEDADRSTWVAAPDGAVAVALAGVSEGMALGYADGAVVLLADAEVQGRWQLSGEITGLWLTDDAGLVVAHVAEEVLALRPGAAPLRLGASREVRVELRPGRGAAVLLPDEDAAVLVGDAMVRRAWTFPVPAAAAYSPSGERFAVALAGPAVLVIAGDEDPGREVGLPEDARGLAFLDEDELVVVGEYGALARVDVAIGEAVRLRGPSTQFGSPEPITVRVLPGGQVVRFGEFGLRFEAADVVPREAAALRAWLTRP